MDEAWASGLELQKLVITVLENNHEMSRRLRAIEMQTRGECSNRKTRSSIQSTIDDALTTRSDIADAAKDQQITRTTSVHVQHESPDVLLPSSIAQFKFTFDQDLKTSRVYKRAAVRLSNFSFPSSAAQSLNWSFFSGQSLADISNISVLSLPISRVDLWNPEHYVNEMRHSKALPKPSSIVQAEAQAVKIVLLGDQWSGKTTILKQFTILQGDHFTMHDRIHARPEIYQYTFGFLKSFLQQPSRKRTSFAAFENRLFTFRDMIKCLRQQLNATESPEGFLVRFAGVIKTVWQECFALHSSHPTSAIYDNGPYYLNNIERLVQPNYLPTDQDILHIYTRTTGVYESCFNINNYAYRVIDVGGARAEHRKWTHCFNNIDYLFFTVPLTGYSQIAYDGTATLMDEALMLFKSLGCVPQLQPSTFVLIFTKLDIFRSMISRKPIVANFPDFEGGDRVDQALSYFDSRFVSQLPSEFLRRELHFKHIDATDINTFKEILEELK